MTDTWSETPPSEPGRYWKVTRHSCGKCWSEAEAVELVERDGVLIRPYMLGQVDAYAYKALSPTVEDNKIVPRPDTLWGPKIEDPEPPEVPQ